MNHDHLLQESFLDRITDKMSRCFRYFPVWKDFLFLSFVIIAYLTILYITEAIFPIINKPVYTNKDMIQTIWSPSSGAVDRYLLAISDTKLFAGIHKKNTITIVKNVISSQPVYQLRCEHNHSYQLSVTALSPTGISSPPSEESTLLICDQKSPRIVLEPLPSPNKLRYPSILIAGTFEEPNLESITINEEPVRMDFLHKRFSARLDLDLGTNHLTLLAKDLAGNKTTKNIKIDYSPVHINSLPAGAKIYWNGNYAYLGIYSDTTPQSFNQALEGKQVLRLTYPGFNDYYGTIDFSALTRDIYTIALTPFSGHDFSQMSRIKANDDEITIDHCAYPFVVDYDMDGKKDLLTGTKEGTIALFINTGTDTAPAFSDYTLLTAADNTIDAGTHAAPFIVDYNNDGAKDLLVGNGDGSLIYYANKGSNTHPVFGLPTPLKDDQGTDIRCDSYCAPCVVDWNRDRKKDLLLGSGDGTLLLYLNRGTDRNPLFFPPRVVEVDGALLDVGSFAAPFSADWNGDGKKDLLVGDGDGFIHLYLDVSTTSEPQFMSSGMVKVNDQDLQVDEGSAVPSLVDWNNDGKKDLIVGSLQGYIYLFTH